MARDHSGCEVWRQDFVALALPAERFDGVFANASLFHVPTTAIGRVLGELHGTLKPGGVLFCSNPRGDGDEGFHGERWGAYRELGEWRALLEQAGFEISRHYTRPEHLPEAQRPWLAIVARRR